MTASASILRRDMGLTHDTLDYFATPLRASVPTHTEDIFSMHYF